LFEGKKKRRWRSDQGGSGSEVQKLDMSFRLCQTEFTWLLGAIILILSAPNVMAVIILARSNQNYPSVAPMYKEVSGVMMLKSSDLQLSCHFGS
jgi:hypothetical protein